MKLRYFLALLLTITLLPGGLSAQVIGLREDSLQAAEYFWDTDPGLGSGTSLSLTRGNSYTAAMELISKTGISAPAAGVHSLNIRSKDSAGTWGIVFTVMVDIESPVTNLREDSLTQAEYFWDNDPGQGGANAMILSRGASYMAAVEGLSQTGVAVPALGVHTLNIRSKDFAGNWGVVFSVIVDVESPITNLREDSLIGAEYFWDNDPGQGSGNPMLLSHGGSYTAALQALVKSNFAVPALGVHTLNIRSKDNAGNWGVVFSVIVDVESPITNLREDSLTLAEYFWDNDPGQGSGSPMLLSHGGSYTAAVQALAQSNFAVPALGVHTLNIRSKDNAGSWGVVFSVIVDVESPITNLREDSLTLAEYFWDNDPGQGSGTAMLLLRGGSYTAAVQALAKSNFAVPALGVHTLNIRSKDFAGNWGVVFSVIVDVESPITNLREDSLTLAEYFWDNDPGQGSGTAMLLSRGGSYTAAVQALVKSNFAVPALGVHTLNIRSKDFAGNWGVVFSVIVDIESPITNLREDSLLSAEYFWDTDPGLGSAHPMLLTRGVTYAAAVEALSQTGVAVPALGVHTLNIRSKDYAGNWGVVFTVIVDVESPVTNLRTDSVIAAEYFFDTDPGLGFATPLLFAGATGSTHTGDIRKILGGNLSAVTAGVHTLYIRSKDFAGRWGVSFGVVVNIDTTVTAPSTITGPLILCSNNLADLYYSSSDTGITYTWAIIGGSITSGADTDSVNVLWNASGPYQLKLTRCTSGGSCSSDSVTITVKPVANATVTLSICQGLSYDGHSTTGTFVDTFTAANGCDSIRTLHLTVISNVTTTVTTSICQGTNYDGHSTNGTFTDTFTAANTCDSIRTLHLTILPVATTTITQTICQGQSYSGHTTSGTFIDTFQAVNTCDSIRTLHLTVNPITTTSVTSSICPGQNYDGHSTIGTYIDTFLNVSGCDSIRTLHLTVLSNVTTSVTTSICQGLSYDGHNTTGTFVDTFIASGGCDSIRTLHLTVISNITTTVTASICQGTNYNGHNTTGTFVDTFTAANSCDSIRTLHLTVLPVASTSVTQTICQGQSYGGHTTSGTFVDTFTAANTCDSIRTLHLTVNPVTNTSVTTSICTGQHYNGHSSTGTYIDTFLSVNGCDSIRTLHLTVQSNIATSITQNICQGTNYDGHSSNGTFVDTFIVSGGCDSIRTLHLTIIPNITTTITAHICQGTNYDGHSSNGTFVDTFTAANTCDSIRTLHLIILPNVTSSVTKSICQGQAYDGHTSSGTFVDTFTAANSCDSVRTLHLTVLPLASSSITQTICSNQSYGGHNVTGTFVDTFAAANSCDSIRTLHLTVLQAVTGSDSQVICQGQSYAGHSTTGTFIDTLTASNQCDSIRTLYLTVVADIRTSVSQAICRGSSYDGHNTAGTFVDTFTASGGCDSIRTLHLSLLSPVSNTVAKNICFGQSYGGHNATGTYIDTFTAINGCDSIRTLRLTVLPLIATTVTKSVCQGQSFAGYVSSGTYVDTFTARDGCDSIRTLNLTVIPVATSNIVKSICRGQIYGGHDSTGTYVDTLTTGSGCDSVRTLHLTVVNAVATTVYDTVCHGRSYGGHSTSGTYIDTLTASAGCDSVRTLYLLVLPVVSNSVTISICQGASYGGHSTAGTFTDTFTATNGCDSIRTLHLSVLQQFTNSINHTVCQGDSFQGHSIAGVYADTLVSSAGCDSIVVLHLHVNPPPGQPTVSRRNDSLISSPAAHYQWYRDSVLLTGDTSKVLVLTRTGNYSVEVTDTSGCSNTSAVIAVVTIGIEEINGLSGISVFPNPTTGELNIQFTGITPGSSLQLQFYDDIGQLLLERNYQAQVSDYQAQLQLQPFAQGMYLLQIKYNGQTTSRRIVLAR